MKQNVYFLTIILFGLISCSTGNNNSTTIDSTNNVEQSKNKSLNDFEEYLKTLDKIPLPLTHNPLGKLPELSKNYDKQRFEKYKHVWTSQPLGILYIDENIVTLIDCSIGDWGLVPFLTTFDKQGHKIDSLGPYKKTGEDNGYYAIEYLKINENKTIIVTDTVKTWTLSKDNATIDETSMKMKLGVTKYTIGEDGKIIEDK